METRTPPNTCHTCGKVLDAATDTGDAPTPRPGDVSICIGCGELMIFTKGLRLRMPTVKEKRDCLQNPKVMAAQLFIRGRR